MKTILILFFAFFVQFTFAQEPPVPQPPMPRKVIEPKSEVIDFPDVQAEFPGGVDAMRAFIRENIKYPPEALKNDEQGKVYVSFVVSARGEISDIRIERGVSKSLDQETLRLMRSMPTWIPGEMNGKKVATRNRLPFSFTI